MISTVGRVLSPRGHGTAFAVSPRYAITAFHCVGDRIKGKLDVEPVEIQFPGLAPIKADAENGSGVLDVAVLRLRVEVPMQAISFSCSVMDRDEFTAYGYPAALQPNDFPPAMTGYVAASISQLYGAPAVQLYCREAGSGLHLPGLSGAPVARAGATVVIGIVRWQPSLRDGMAASGGMLYATPVSAFANEPWFAQTGAQLLPERTGIPTPAREQIDSIPVHRKLNIDGISYGQPPHRVNVERSDLMTLSASAKLCERKSTFFKLTRFPMPLGSEADVVALGKQVFMPHAFSVTVEKPEDYKASRFVLYVCTDAPYQAGEVMTDETTVFRQRVHLGRGGVAAFVDGNGIVLSRDDYTVGGGIGCVGALVAVGYGSEGPQIRSRYVIVVRKGIRYPDDTWISSKTRGPICSVAAPVVKGRFVFQSRQEDAWGSAIFCVDYNGERLRNITVSEKECMNSFTNEDGEEIVRWTESGEVEFASNFRGYGALEIVRRRDSV